MKAHHHTDVHGHDLTTCIAACSECSETCEEMIYQHCLKLGGKHVEPEHLKLMADCVEICRASAGFMRRGSPRHGAICLACAEICSACADDCERIGDMDECVTTCRRCADICREMAT